MLGLKHVSIGCNRSIHCADWNIEGTLAYGSGVYVSLAGSEDEVIKRAVCVGAIKRGQRKKYLSHPFTYEFF